MQRARVSVTITSLTDIVAFACRGSTAIPGFSSLRVYCSVGLIAIHLHTITFFTANLVLKQHHVDNSRDSCFPCKQRRPTDRNDSKKRISMNSIYRDFGWLFMKLSMKIIILIITFIMLGVACWGCTMVEQRTFLPDLLNPGTYLRKWYDFREQHFDGQMDAAAILISDIKSGDFEKIHNILEALRKEEKIIENVSSWTKDFATYTKLLPNNKDPLHMMEMSEELFQEKLTQFLFSPDGSQYRGLFTFPRGSHLKCGEAAPPVSLVTIPFSYILMKDAAVYVPAMNKIKSLVKSANLTGINFPFATTYFIWETDEAIAVEFPRNLTVGLVAIFILTLLFLMDLQITFLVILCVIMSLVNTIGFGFFGDLKLNTSSLIIISTGLYVDYCVHVAHSFSKQTQGTSEERII